MKENEKEAHELAAALQGLGLNAEVEGKGVHWRVVAGDEQRSLLIHCFWYGHIAGLMMGMNQANSRAGVSPKARAVPQGAQFLITLIEEGRDVVSGRTFVRSEAVAASRAWLESGDVVAVREVAPFVDRRRQAMLARSQELTGHDWELMSEPGHVMWVYGNGRSCKVSADDNEPATCAFLLGQVVVGVLNDVADLRGAVGAWLSEAVPIGELEKAIPGVAMARHVEHLDTNPALWHWLHVQERLEDPDDVLADLAPFIQMLAESSIATRFFSYSSLNRFCFSSSSHYPWVDEGLPVIAPAREPKSVWVDEERLGYEAALGRVERLLEAAEHEPFVGTSVDVEIHEWRRLLAQRNSSLKLELLQREQWRRIGIRRDSMSIRFSSGSSVRMQTVDSELWTSWPSDEAAMDAALRFLENGAPLEDFVEASNIGITARST